MNNMPQFNTFFPRQEPFNFELENIKNQINIINEELRRIEKRIITLEKNNNPITPTPIKENSLEYSNNNYIKGNYIL